MALNFLSSIMIAEPNVDKKHQIEFYVSKLIEVCEKNPKYDEKVIEIYYSILKHEPVVDETVLAVA